MVIVHGDPDFLAHYGILGMKWGIRRYQNPDGSYTTAGKARYSTKKEFKADLKADRKTAQANSQALATADAALRYSNRRLDKAKRAIDKDGGYDAASNRKRLRLDTEQAVNDKLREKLGSTEKAAYDHMNELIQKYGEQNVKKIRKDSSGYGGEYDNSPAFVKSAIGSVLMSVGLSAGMIASGIPFVTLFSPKSSRDLGIDEYKRTRIQTSNELRRR